MKEVPLTLADKEILQSIERFSRLESDFPNQFIKYVIVSNCPCLDDKSGKSITNLLNQAKSDTSEVSFSPGELEKFIMNLTNKDHTRKEVIGFLRKVEYLQAPGLDDINSKIIERYIGSHPSCINIPTSTLRLIYDKIRLLVYDASSKRTTHPINDFKAFVMDSDNVENMQQIEGKHITKDNVEKIISEVIEENNKLFSASKLIVSYPYEARFQPENKLQDISEGEVMFYTDRIGNSSRSSPAKRSALKELELLARMKILWKHDSIWNILDKEIRIDDITEDFVVAIYLLKRMLKESKERSNEFNKVYVKTRDLFLARFKQIISSTDPKWYDYKGEAKQILQYITNEQELFQILWNAWKECVYIEDTNQYTRSISAFINNLLELLHSKPDLAKYVIQERYELLESPIKYIASRTGELL